MKPAKVALLDQTRTATDHAAHPSNVTASTSPAFPGPSFRIGRPITARWGRGALRWRSQQVFLEGFADRRCYRVLDDRVLDRQPDAEEDERRQDPHCDGVHCSPSDV